MVTPRAVAAPAAAPLSERLDSSPGQGALLCSHPEKDMLDSSLERITRKLSCHKKLNIIGLNKIVLIQENRIGLNVIFYQNEKFLGVILDDI